MSNDRLAVIIVSWNTCDYLEKCLTSLYRNSENPQTEVWVVDNHSDDGSVDMVRAKFPQVHLLVNRENVGFSRACNQGIEASAAEYILLLNSDCELLGNFIDPILAVMREDQTIGVAGTILLHSNGKVQKAGGTLLSLRQIFSEQILFRSAALFADSIEEVGKRHGSTGYFTVDFVSGACLFTRRSLIAEIGPLREDFFMYGEDVEFCLRAQRKGYLIVVFGNQFVVHHKSKSSEKNLEKALRHSLINNAIIRVEREGKAAALLSLLYYYIGGWLRFILAFFRRGVNPWAWFKLLLSYHRVVGAVLKKQHIKSFSS